MDTELLKTFLEVRSCRHFGKAAENLYLTQAAVSSRIRQLEQHFGATLFIRNRNNIQLTQAGERLVSHAEAILTSLQLARLSVANSSEPLAQFAVAGTANVWDCFLRQAISVIYDQQPNINLSAELLSREQLARQILERNLDVAILLDSLKNDEIKTEKLSTLQLLPVIASDEPKHDSVAEPRYIAIDWGSSCNQWLTKQVKNLPIPALRTSTASIALDLILQCGGMAYLPNSLVNTFIDNGQLQIVAELPQIERDIYIAFHQDNEHKAKLTTIKKLLGKG